MAALDELVGAFADVVARRVVELLTAGQQPGMLDQTGSPLGRRRHIAAVRRRVAANEPGAAIVGRRHLLSREALQSELEALQRKLPRKPGKAGKAAADADADLAPLLARYGVQRRAS